MDVRATRTTLLFLALALCMTPATTETIYRFERMWPTLAQPWYFNSPAGLACDASGNVYIADSFNGRVQKYTSQGQFITMWNGAAQGGDAFEMPQDIAVDMDDNVYVLDGAACRVRVFIAMGAEIAAWGEQGSGPGQFDGPRGIALDHQGNVFVADTQNHRIQYFDAWGNWLGVMGNDAKTGATLREPQGLDSNDQGVLYVADTGNHRVVALDTDGAFLNSWGESGDSPGAFDRPARVLVDGAGHVYVSDTGNFRVQKFTDTGEFMLAFGGEGRGSGEFAVVDGLAMNRFGHLLVADRGWHDRIQVFTETGLFISMWGSQWGGRNEFDGPTDIVPDGDGNLYIADYGNSRIQRLSAAGRFLGFWGPGQGDPGHCRRPYSMALDAARDLVHIYDLDDNYIRRYDLDGAFIQEWHSQLNDPHAFASFAGLAAAHGRLYMADSVNSRVRVFASEGALLDDWGERGNGDGQLFLPYDVDVAADGLVYVADTYNNRVQVFGAGGMHQRGWGVQGDGPGEFRRPGAIFCASDGTVFVSDSDNHRIQQFTAKGEFLTAFGGPGAAPGQFNKPAGLVALGNDRVVVADRLNNRLQQFHGVDQAARAKAIIVAGGGPIPGNALWDATRLCAHFAYHVLRHAGYAREDIYLLSADRDVDLDNDGLANNVADDCTLAALEYGLTAWVDEADLLVVYLVNHGGPDTFRMNAEEILDAPLFAQWLAAARERVAGPMLIVNDSCHSGSFIGPLAEADIEPTPLVIASAAPEQSAYFLGTGTVSFSSVFWMEILNGHDAADAFQFAAATIQDIYGLQTPQLDGTGDGTVNRASDFEAAARLFLGTSGGESTRPVINTVIVPESLEGANAVEIIAADIASEETVAQVWAVVRPPGLGVGGGSPIIAMPTVSLDPTESLTYSGVYEDVSIPGDYQITVHARDVAGNASQPVMRTVSVDNMLRSRAVIVAAAAPGSPFWNISTKNALLAYQALQFQGYAEEDIRFYCAETIAPGVAGLPTLDNLRFAVTEWAAADTRDLVVYLVGVGAHQMIELSPGEFLFAETLNAWLNAQQETLPGRVVVVCDFCASGSFLPALAGVTDGRRIVVSGCGMDSAPSFSSDGEVSFSRFFWRQVLAGANLRGAFLHAVNALRFASAANAPQLDDTGDGLYRPGVDGRIAATVSLGRGVQLASDRPVILEVSPAQTLGAKNDLGENAAEIWANPITSMTPINRVFAVVFPPNHDPRDCGVTDPGGYVLDMTRDDLGRYVVLYDGFGERGIYNILCFAEDAQGEVSAPAFTHVEQQSATVAPDAYEPDDTPETASWIGVNDEAQRHNFCHEGDEDWALFFAREDQVIVVETRNLGPAADTLAQLYRRSEEPEFIMEDAFSNPYEEGASLLQWRADVEGFYLVRVTNLPPEAYGADAYYDLLVRDDTGMELPGAIATTITDANTHAALDGVAVVLANFGGLSTITNPQGVALFQALPGGEYTLVAKKAGYHDFNQSVVVTPSQTSNVPIAMRPVASAEGEGEEPTRTTPNLVGLTREQAVAALADAGLTLGAVNEEYHVTIAIGAVISQSPEAGAHVPPGTAVTITISLGPPPIESVAVPNLSGMTQSEAVAALDAVGLLLGAVAEAYHPTIPAGIIISQSPLFGAQVPPGSAVSISVSLGPESSPEGEGEGEPGGGGGCRCASNNSKQWDPGHLLGHWLLLGLTLLAITCMPTKR